MKLKKTITMYQKMAIKQHKTTTAKKKQQQKQIKTKQNKKTR